MPAYEIELWRRVTSSALLIFLRFLVGMDLYTVPGTLTTIQSHYEISDKVAGLMHMAYVVVETLAMPVMGFLGDRFDRRFVIVASGIFCLACQVSSSFIPEDMSGWFFVLRMLTGVGAAMTLCLVPPMLSDYFEDAPLGYCLILFYNSFPLGSAVGATIGALIAASDIDFKWAFRITPPFGVLTLVAILLIVRESFELKIVRKIQNPNRNSWAGLMEILKTKTSVFILGLGGVLNFLIEGYSFWGPTLIKTASIENPDAFNGMSKETTIGIITFTAALSACAGSLTIIILAERWRVGSQPFEAIQTERAHAYTLMIVIVLFVISIYTHIQLIATNIVGVAILASIVFMMAGACPTLYVRMLMKVVVTENRSMAMAFMNILFHCIADGPAPFIVGALKEGIQENIEVSPFIALQKALLIIAGVTGVAFVLASLIAIFYPSDIKDERIESREEIESTRSLPVLVNAQY